MSYGIERYKEIMESTAALFGSSQRTDENKSNSDRSRQTHRADVLDNCSLAMRTVLKTIDIISPIPQAVLERATAKDISDLGWVFWRVNEAVSKRDRRIKELEDELLARSSTG